VHIEFGGRTLVDDGAVVMVILAVLRRRVSESRAICGDARNFASEQIDR
jgi:hypothetical protein